MADRPASPFGGLDKALIRSTRDSRLPASPPPEPTSIEVNSPATMEARKHSSSEVEQPTSAVPPASKSDRLRKVGYYFTRDEVDLVDDLHHELRKQYRLGLTKSDVIRVAVAFLEQDYRDNPEQSYLLREARRKHSSKQAQTAQRYRTIDP